MQDNEFNRMKRPVGRPPIIDQKTPLPQPAENVEIPQKPLLGLTCPACGRAMIPRRDRMQPSKCYAHCSLCGARMVLTFAGERYISVRRVDRLEQ